MANGRRKDPLIWGLILIGIGAIFLLHNLEYDVWDFVARLWPVILIIWGGWKLYYGLLAKKEESENP